MDQVNPDTNTDTGYEYFEKGANTGMVVSSPTVEAANGRIKYTITLHPKKTGVNGASTSTTLNDITADFYVNSSDIGDITSATSIKITSSAVSNKKTTVNVSGNGADTSGGFVLAAGSNVNLTGGGNSDITISATDTTYSLSSGNGGNSDAKVSLTPSVDGTAGTAQNVYFKAGADLTVDGSTAGEITYAHATYGAPTVTPNLAADDAAYSADGVKESNVVDAITTTNGHVTSVTKKRVSVTNNTFSANTITADNTGKITYTIKNDQTNATTTGESGKVLFHKITVDGTEVTKYNQESLGSFYSAAEVDNKINSLNAMTYKGKVGATADGADVTSLPTTPPTGANALHVGDTYLVVTDGTYGGKAAKVGDLLIASGTETDGAISSNLDWTLVQAGERDTTYEYQVVTLSDKPAIQYRSSTNQAWSTLVDFNGGTAIDISLANGTITIAHGNSGVTAGQKGDNSSITGALTYGGTFKVPDVTVDAQGHVTALTEKEIQLPASDNTTYSISATQPSGSNARITLTATGGGTTNAYVVGDGTSISTSVPSSGANQGSLVITHSNLLTSGTAGTAYGVSASATPAAGSGVIKVPNITVNAQGHVTTITEQSITLPPDTHYSFSGDPTVTADSNVATAQFSIGND